MDELLSTKHENIIIVSHGITLQLFFAIWIGLDFDDLKNFGLLALSGGVSNLILTDDGRRVIKYLNNMSYQSLSAK